MPDRHQAQYLNTPQTVSYGPEIRQAEDHDALQAVTLSKASSDLELLSRELPDANRHHSPDGNYNNSTGKLYYNNNA